MWYTSGMESFMREINKNIPIMQTHLDFHTSPDIKGIGSRFSKDNFQKALKTGNLDSITVFAKCHHSMCYYPTKVGVMHPNLDFDLTGAMIDAAHEIGVRAPVYITAGWSDYDAKMHPEWVMVNKDGTKRVMGGIIENANATDPKPHCHWDTLCLSDGNDYTKHIYELTEEVCLRYSKVDGLFYDICVNGDACYCESCKSGMLAMGMNPNNDGDAKRYFIMKRQAFMQKCRGILRKYHPDATIFFNGCAYQYSSYFHDYQSHFEMENLPTAWGGYYELPMRSKVLFLKGKDVIGMTGKFHLSWGEFGGFKSKEALKYEVAMMAQYGVGASIGDHMHPDGEMEMQTYENIGYAYKYLEKIAPYCYGGQSTANLGICTSSSREANEGISNILLENQLDYDLVCNYNFAKFDTVIIPGKVILDDVGLAALKEYVDKGGKLILMADALVKDGKFQLDFGINYLGESEYDCDYLIPLIQSDTLPGAPVLCNFPGHRVDAKDATVYAEFVTPYFSRTFEHFCGHQNTPYNKEAIRYPAIMKKGNVVYISHILSMEYATYGSLYHKCFFIMALEQIYCGSKISVKGLGSQGRCTMIHQPEQKRYCINITYASPVKRGKAEVIEDIMTLYHIDVSVEIKEAVKRVYLGVTSEELTFMQDKGKIHFVIPQMNCHTSIVVEYR